LRYESIQYFVGRPFYAQKTKNIKNCAQPKTENKAARVPGNRRFIFCKLQKMKRRLPGKICSMLKSIQKLLPLFLMDRRFSLGRRVGLKVQINNLI